LEALPVCPVFNWCFYGWKYYGNLLETVGPRVPNRNFRDIRLFTLTLNVKSALRQDALRRANGIGSDTDIFNRSSVLVNDWLVSGSFAI
jgi:hypothetical protein